MYSFYSLWGLGAHTDRRTGRHGYIDSLLLVLIDVYMYTVTPCICPFKVCSAVYVTTDFSFKNINNVVDG